MNLTRVPLVGFAVSRRSPFFRFAIVLLMGSVSTLTAAELPGSVAPGQIEKRFEAPPAPRALPEIIVPESAAPTAPQEASRIRFELKGVEVEGATVFPADELKALYADLLNQEITLEAIYGLAGRLTAHYGNQGYLLSRVIVPPQTITDGTVRLKAVEGYVDRVIYEGDAADRPALFDHYAARIRESRPLQADVLERYLLLANDLAGVQAEAVLRPSSDNSGAATLVVTLRHKRFDGLVSLDNRGSDAVGPEQLYIEANANSLLRRYDHTTVRAATNPIDSKELRYFFLGHGQVLDDEGTVLSASATHSGSEPGTATLRMLDLKTVSRSAELTLSHPYLRSRSRNLTVSGSLVYRTTETEILGATLSEDRGYAARAGLVFDHADPWSGVNLYALTLTRGIDADVETRSDVPSDFTALRLHASRNQTLSENWFLLLRLSGQAAGSSLPSAELFGLGGEAFGRGYDPSEWVGDQGLAGSLDLVFRAHAPWVPVLQNYVFYDAGTVLRRHPVNEPGSQNAHSAGLGVQAGLPGGLSLSLEAAKPLGERASSDENNDWRIFARATAQF